MNSIAVYLAIEPRQGRPIALARLADADILRTAATAAIATARRRAEDANGRDPLLGEFCEDEARRLEQYLGRLIPGLTPEAAMVV